MARLIIHTAKEPRREKIGDKMIAICMCGLSNNYPFCDGSHKKTKDEKEEAIYLYTQDGKRIEIIEELLLRKV